MRRVSKKLINSNYKDLKSIQLYTISAFERVGSCESNDWLCLEGAEHLEKQYYQW